MSKNRNLPRYIDLELFEVISGPKRKQMKIYLDDVRNAPEGWELARNAQEFEHLYEANKQHVTHISLDHDLGDNQKTGHDVVKYLMTNVVEEMKVSKKLISNFPLISCHSANPVGKKNIMNCIHDIEMIITGDLEVQ